MEVYDGTFCGPLAIGINYKKGRGSMQNIDKLLKEYNLCHKKEDLLKIAASSIGIVKEIVKRRQIFQ